MQPGPRAVTWAPRKSSLKFAPARALPNALERIRDPEIKQHLLQASREAIELGVFGVPTMIVDDELFWGTDSFPHLTRYLRGDDPVRPEDVEAWRAVAGVRAAKIAGLLALPGDHAAPHRGDALESKLLELERDPP